MTLPNLLLLHIELSSLTTINICGSWRHGTPAVALLECFLWPIFTPRTAHGNAKGVGREEWTEGLQKGEVVARGLVIAKEERDCKGVRRCKKGERDCKGASCCKKGERVARELVIARGARHCKGWKALQGGSVPKGWIEVLMFSLWPFLN